MKQAAEFTVCYDLSDDKERAAVSKILCGYGFRVQKSVFECKLTRADQGNLLRGLQRLGLQSGSVKLYRVYGGARHPVIGQPQVDPDEDHVYVL